jgi:hypothetical protein
MLHNSTHHRLLWHGLLGARKLSRLENKTCITRLITVNLMHKIICTRKKQQKLKDIKATIKDPLNNSTVHGLR